MNSYIIDLTDNYRNSLESVFVNFQKYLKNIGVSQAHACNQLIKNIKISCNQQTFLLEHIATVEIISACNIEIKPWNKDHTSPIYKSLTQAKSHVNFSVQITKHKICIRIFPMTKDKRQDIIQNISKSGEQRKSTVRGMRNNAQQSLKKYSKINNVAKDYVKRYQQDIDRSTLLINNKLISEIKLTKIRIMKL